MDRSKKGRRVIIALARFCRLAAPGLPSLQFFRQQADSTMDTNRYTPPDAHVADLTEPTGAPVRAIIFGLLVDIGGTTLLAGVLSVIVGVLLMRTGKSPQDIEQMLTHFDSFSGIGLLLTGAGLFCSFCGGYVCAAVSKLTVIRDTAIMAVISASLGVLMSWSEYSSLQHIMLSLLNVVTIFVGAGLWLRTHR